MSIKKVIVGGFALISIFLIGTFIIMMNLKASQTNLSKMEDLRYSSRLAATELRQSSDDLTRLARLYVVTKNLEPEQAKEYLREYNAILDIRNGKVPRPEKYDDIFWDFAAIDGRNPTQDSNTTESLNEIMKELNFTNEEFSLLKQANDNSDGLVNTEVMAMRFVDGKIGPNERAAMLSGETPQQTAIRIMHDKSYMTNKANIMRPINEFFDKLDARTALAVSNAQSRVIKLTILGIMVLVLSLALMIAISMIMLTSVLGSISILKVKLDELSKAGGDLTAKIDIKTKNEIGDLANVVNKLLSNLREIIAAVVDEAKNVEASVGVVSNNMKDLYDNMHEISATTEEMSASMEQTAASTEEMNATAEEISHAVEAIALKAQQGSMAATEIKKRADNLKMSAKQSQENANEIYETAQERLKNAIAQSKEVEQINTLSNAIMSITEQTNLLALNAAIEAARAGEAGKGFAVVADEIRKLADESKKTAGEIQDITKTVIESFGNLSGSSDLVLQFIEKQVIKDYEMLVKSGEQYSDDAAAINNLVTNFSATSEELLASIHSMTEAIGEIASTNNDNVNGITSIAASSSDMTGMASDVNGKAEDSKKSTAHLLNIVSKFTV